MTEKKEMRIVPFDQFFFEREKNWISFGLMWGLNHKNIGTVTTSSFVFGSDEEIPFTFFPRIFVFHNSGLKFESERWLSNQIWFRLFWFAFGVRTDSLEYNND